MPSDSDCPFCHASIAFLFTATDRNRGLGGSFAYSRCSECGLVFNTTPPRDINRYYVGGYQKIPSTVAELREMAKMDAYRLEPVLRLHRQGKLLEIGPWMGLFCILAKDAGFDVTAIEMSQDCVRFLTDQVGVHAIESADPAVTLANLDETFDVIVMWHSIEHLPQPWNVVREAARRLKPAGVLLIAAPNPESSQMRLLRENWMHLDAPRHQYLLPISLVQRIGEENGLVPVSVTTRDELSQEIERQAWGGMIHPWVPVPGVRRLVKFAARGVLDRIYRTGVEGNGAGYTVVLQRQ